MFSSVYSYFVCSLAELRKTPQPTFTKFSGKVGREPRRSYQILVVIRITLRQGQDQGGINVTVRWGHTEQVLSGVCLRVTIYSGSAALAEVCAPLSAVLINTCLWYMLVCRCGTSDVDWSLSLGSTNVGLPSRTVAATAADATVGTRQIGITVVF